MTKLNKGEYKIYTSKRGIEYQVQNKNGNLVMVDLHSVFGFKILKATKEIHKLFEAI